MRTEETVAAMSCPICRTGLVLSDRQGVEIDYCPTCRGVWLDRGELDRIIARNTEMHRLQRARPGRAKAESQGTTTMAMTIAATATRSGRGSSCPTVSTERRRRMRHAVVRLRRNKVAGRRRQRWNIITSGPAAS